MHNKLTSYLPSCTIILAGILSVWFAQDYHDNLSHLSAGIFPTIVGSWLFIFGLLLIKDNSANSQMLISTRIIITLLISIISYGLLIEKIGLILATIISLALSQTAITITSLKTTMLINVIITTIVVIIFWGLFSIQIKLI